VTGISSNWLIQRILGDKVMQVFTDGLFVYTVSENGFCIVTDPGCDNLEICTEDSVAEACEICGITIDELTEV
jgi:hypothetical protein